MEQNDNLPLVFVAVFVIFDIKHHIVKNLDKDSQKVSSEWVAD